MKHRMQLPWTIWFLLHMHSCLLDHIKKDLEQDQYQMKMELLFSWKLNPLVTYTQSISLLLLVKQVLASPQHLEPVREWIYQQDVVARLWQQRKKSCDDIQLTTKSEGKVIWKNTFSEKVGKKKCFWEMHLKTSLSGNMFREKRNVKQKIVLHQ